MKIQDLMLEMEKSKDSKKQSEKVVDLQEVL